MKTQKVCAMRISRQIYSIEDKVDLLLAEVANLMSEMTRYRIDTDLDANIGQRAILSRRAISRVADIQSKLIEARMRAVGAHSDIQKIIETTTDVPSICPEVGVSQSSEARLISINE